MSATIPDVFLDGTQYVSLNAASGVPVGSPFTIQNKTTTRANLIESSTQPAVDSPKGILITNLTDYEASKDILSGSLEIWGISTNENRTVRLAIQPL